MMVNLDWRQRIPILASAGLFLLLLFASTRTTFAVDQHVPLALFLLLMVSALTLGISSGSGGASLISMSIVAAFLVLGLLPALWLLFVSALLHGLFRYFYGDHLLAPRIFSRRELISRTAANASILSFSLLTGAWGYLLLGGEAPQTDSLPLIIPYIVLSVLFLITNHVLVGLYLWFTEKEQYVQYRRHLAQSFLFEATPFLFAPTLVSVYMQLGWGHFAMFAFGVFLVSLITFNVALTRQRLEKRVQELASLQQIGTSLSASLDLERVLQVIQQEVAKAIPVSTFFVALYNADQETIHFPLVLREGELAEWGRRQCGNGLTEFVLRTRRPLLIRDNVVGFIAAHNLELIGEPSSCWLGVPIKAGDELLGVLSVQSIYQANLYDEHDQSLLETIAAQAALAIRNAQLYSQTNEELRRRVRELISIMRTTTDGLLLIGRNGRVLAVNHAFAEMVGLEETAIQRRFIGKEFVVPPAQQASTDGAGELKLLQKLGYTSRQIAADCAAILHGEFRRRRELFLPASDRQMMATLTPVLNQDEQPTDWLLVVRNVTEERKLNQMRDDMTHMLVHDLRSPLGVLLGSLQASQEWLVMGALETLPELLSLAQQSGERMLRMIDDILNIYKFETGQIPLQKRPVEVEPLLLEVKLQLRHWAEEAQIEVRIDLKPNLPPVCADPDHLGRTVQNLLDNAIKFSPDESIIRLWAGFVDEEAAVLIGVQDYGPGIPAEFQERLFKKFQRLTSSGRRRGTGLGLAYCRLVATAHGGSIWVESSGEPGEGSNFILKLPAVAPDDP